MSELDRWGVRSIAEDVAGDLISNSERRAERVTDNLRYKVEDLERSVEALQYANQELEGSLRETNARLEKVAAFLAAHNFIKE